jgi:hypothetical protein
VNVIANSLAGALQVNATATAANTAGNVPGSALFDLTNRPAAVLTLEYVSGSPQASKNNTAFAQPLVARVKDDSGNPMAGVSVSFAAPVSTTGVASATFPAGNTAITNASGLASVNVTANATAGSYTVTANSVGVPGTTSYLLTNQTECGHAEVVKFLDLKNAPRRGFITSNTVQVNGLGQGCSAAASIAQGEIKVMRGGINVTQISKLALVAAANSGFSTLPQTVQDGDQIILGQTTSDRVLTTTTATLTLDGDAYPWSATTGSDVAIPPEPIPVLPDEEPARSLMLMLIALMLAGWGGWALRQRQTQKHGVKP